MKQSFPKFPLIKPKTQEEKNAENLATAFSTIFGTKIVSGFDYEKINKENQILLERTKSIDKIKDRLISTQCKLYAFIDYHRQWKPTTRNFEKRLKTLKKEKLYLNLEDYPIEISENLREAYNCYVNGLSMSSYIMILRTMEITINIVYEKFNPVVYDEKGKAKFIPASIKLNWVKNQKLVGGFDYNLAKNLIESRNDAVHEIFVPTDRQILSALETVSQLIQKLKTHL